MLLADAPMTRRSTRDGRAIRVASGAVVVGVAGVAALAAVVPTERGEALDRAISGRFQANLDPRVERAMTAVSWPGFPPQSRVLPLAYAALLWSAGFRREARYQLAASGAGVLSTAAKSVMRRPRPVAGTGLRVVAASLHGSSMPSGHVLTYTAVYGWLAILARDLIGPAAPRRLAVGALTTLVAAIGPSRIYLGHHWPSDVIASYALGSSYLGALFLVYRRRNPRRPTR